MKLDDLYVVYANLVSEEMEALYRDLTSARGRKKLELHLKIVGTLSSRIGDRGMKAAIYNTTEGKESAYSHLKRSLYNDVVRVLACSTLRVSQRPETIALRAYLAARQLIDRGDSDSAFAIMKEAVTGNSSNIQAQLMQPFICCEYLTWFGASRLSHNMLADLKERFCSSSDNQSELFIRQYALKVIATQENQLYSTLYGHKTCDVSSVLEEHHLDVLDPDEIEKVSSSPFVVNLQYRLAILATRDYKDTRRVLRLSRRYLQFLKTSFSAAAYHAGGHYTLGLSLYGVGLISSAAIEFNKAFSLFQGPNEIKFHCKHYELLCQLNRHDGKQSDLSSIFRDLKDSLKAIPSERVNFYNDWLNLLDATTKLCCCPADFHLDECDGMSYLYKDTEGWRYFIRCLEAFDSLFRGDFPRFQLLLDSMRKHLYSSNHLDAPSLLRMDRAYRWFSSVRVIGNNKLVYQYAKIQPDKETWIPFSWEIVPFDRLVESFIKTVDTPATRRQ